ncbi:hypothetical protein F4X73_06790, partial [Candidatus Poribacteria bacterium]|nr:hypothetical protein [Candidatus Poribacteria bacterium]
MRLYFYIFCLVLMFSPLVDAKIVFDSKRDGSYGIYVMDDDGSNEMLLTDMFGPKDACWSPNGKHIVFSRRAAPGRDSQQRHLFIMRADGTNIRQLTPPVKPFGRDSFPSFSPDSESVIFNRYEVINNRNKKSSVCVMNLKSGKIKKIYDSIADFPKWSPDGRYIVFTTAQTAGVSGNTIMIMKSDGGHPRELLPTPPNNGQLISYYSPRWHPDSKQILYKQSFQTLGKDEKGVTFYIPQGYYYFIYNMQDEKTRKLQIPDNLHAYGLDWMDNGASVVFSAHEVELNVRFSHSQPPTNIYKYDIKSRNITQLTN